MDEEESLVNGFCVDDRSSQLEIKKELSEEHDIDNSNAMLGNSEDDIDDDCITSNDGIFEVIPFMAKLLSNLKCSFYSRNTEIVIASIELMSVHELTQRLIKNRIRPNRMTSCSDSTFTLSICDDQFTKLAPFPGDNGHSIVRYLPNMAIVTECSNLSLFIDRQESILIRAISYDSLAALMARLKQYDIRPKQVDSLKNSLFSLVFNQQSFANVDDIHNFYPTTDNAGEPMSIRRPRICPNYLRDYVVEHKDEPVSGLDLVRAAGFATAAAAAVSMQQRNSGLIGGGGSTSKSMSSDDTAVGAPPVKRGRGRPRLRPEPSSEYSVEFGQMKKPRGRPRRSDVVPNIIARTNSFINIQPKGLSAQEIENCFVKFLESDIVAFRQPK